MCRSMSALSAICRLSTTPCKLATEYSAVCGRQKSEHRSSLRGALHLAPRSVASVEVPALYFEAIFQQNGNENVTGRCRSLQPSLPRIRSPVSMREFIPPSTRQWKTAHPALQGGSGLRTGKKASAQRDARHPLPLDLPVYRHDGCRKHQPPLALKDRQPYHFVYDPRLVLERREHDALGGAWSLAHQD